METPACHLLGIAGRAGGDHGGAQALPRRDSAGRRTSLATCTQRRSWCCSCSATWPARFALPGGRCGREQRYSSSACGRTSTVSPTAATTSAPPPISTRRSGERSRSRARGPDPDFRPEFYLPTAQEYFAVIDAYGSTAAYTPDELSTRPPLIRAAADRVLVGALGLRLAPTPAGPPHDGHAPRVARTLTGFARTRSGCVRLRPGKDLASTSEPAPLAELDLPAGGVWIGGDRLAEAGFLLGRFADAPAIRLAPPATRRAAILRIPVDAVRLPWRLLVASPRSVSVCGLHR